MSKLKEHIRSEHALLRPHVELIRIVADSVGNVRPVILRDLTEAVLGFCVRELLPHTEGEDRIIARAVEEALHAPGAGRGLGREVIEIRRLVEELTSLGASIEEDHDVTHAVERDLRRVLYGLHALVSLHFAAEDEVYAALLEAKLPADEQDLLLETLARL